MCSMLSQGCKVIPTVDPQLSFWLYPSEKEKEKETVPCQLQAVAVRRVQRAGGVGAVLGGRTRAAPRAPAPCQARCAAAGCASVLGEEWSALFLLLVLSSSFLARCAFPGLPAEQRGAWQIIPQPAARAGAGPRIGLWLGCAQGRGERERRSRRVAAFCCPPAPMPACCGREHFYIMRTKKNPWFKEKSPVQRAVLQAPPPTCWRLLSWRWLGWRWSGRGCSCRCTLPRISYFLMHDGKTVKHALNWMPPAARLRPCHSCPAPAGLLARSQGAMTRPCCFLLLCPAVCALPTSMPRAVKQQHPTSEHTQ